MSRRREKRMALWEHKVRLVIKDNKVVGEERLLLDQHQRMRDIAMGPDGNL